MRTVVVAATIATGVLLASSPVVAECADPRPAMFPLGDDVPPHPTLVRFEPAYREPTILTVTDGERPLPFTTRDLTTTDAIRVTEIRVDVERGPIVIRARGDEDEYHFEVSAPTAVAAPVVTKATRIDDRWTCSFTDGLALEVTAPGAVAIEARWSDGTRATVAPDVAAYSGGRGASTEWTSMVLLGHVSCLGDQLPPDRIGALDLTLTALYADGARRPLPWQPDTIAGVLALVIADDGRTPQRDPDDEPPALRALPSLWRRPALAAFALAALTLGVGLVSRARRRRAAAISL